MLRQRRGVGALAHNSPLPPGQWTACDVARKYASDPLTWVPRASRAALHLDLLEQPAGKDVLGTLLDGSGLRRLPARGNRAEAPALSIASVAGTAAPGTPAGSYTSPDILLPSTTTNPVTVTLAAGNIPLGTTVTVTVTPAGDPAARPPARAWRAPWPAPRPRRP